MTVDPTAAAARGTGLLLLGLIDAKRAAAKVHAVELLRGLHRIFRVLEIDEGEAARPTCHPVRGKEDFANRAGLREQVANLVRGGLEVEVADKQFRAHRAIFFLGKRPEQPDCCS